MGQYYSIVRFIFLGHVLHFLVEYSTIQVLWQRMGHILETLRGQDDVALTVLFIMKNPCVPFTFPLELFVDVYSNPKS
jgi:hypothetical protein